MLNIKIAILGISESIGQRLLNNLHYCGFAESNIDIFDKINNIKIALMYSDFASFKIQNVNNIKIKQYDVVILCSLDETFANLAMMAASDNILIMLYANNYYKNNHLLPNDRPPESVMKLLHQSQPIISDFNVFEIVQTNTKIVRNPTVAAFIIVLILSKLQSKYMLKSVVVSTYQSVSRIYHRGDEILYSGAKALVSNVDGVEYMQNLISFNVMQSIGFINSDNESSEELQSKQDIEHILQTKLPSLTINCVGVSVFVGVGLFVHITSATPWDQKSIMNVLSNEDQDSQISKLSVSVHNRNNFTLKDMTNINVISINRIRVDNKNNTLSMWVCFDEATHMVNNITQSLQQIIQNKTNVALYEN